MELCYSTKPIQGVAVSFCWTAKVINRAITKEKKKNTRNDRQNRKQRLKYININTMSTIVQVKGSVTQKANAHIYNIDIYILYHPWIGQ